MAVLQRLLPRFQPASRHRPASPTRPRDAVGVRWLGTAGHVITTPRATLLLDPYLTRASFRELARPVAPRTTVYDAWIPKKVDAILLGHSHYDHLLDAPAIAKRTGAVVVGSASTLAFARAEGVAEDKLVLVPPEGRDVEIADVRARFVPSLHGRIAFGRVPLPGHAEAHPRVPAPFWRYRMGGAFGILLEVGGRTLYHNGSADLIDANVEGARADVLLVGLAGRRATRDYLKRLVAALSPGLLVPTHHDAVFGPLEDGERLLPGIDLPGFVREAAGCAPAAAIITPLYRDEIVLPVDGDVRDAGIVAWSM